MSDTLLTVWFMWRIPKWAETKECHHLCALLIELKKCSAYANSATRMFAQRIQPFLQPDGDLIELWNDTQTWFILASSGQLFGAVDTDRSERDMFKEWGQIKAVVESGSVGEREACSAATLSHDLSCLATGTCQGRVKIWDLATQANVFSGHVHGPRINFISFSPDGSTLAAVVVNENIDFEWDDYWALVFKLCASDGSLLGMTRLDGGEVTCVARSASGAKLVLGSRQGQAFWVLGSDLSILYHYETPTDVSAMCFTSSGTLLVGWERGSNHGLLWFDKDEDEPIHSLNFHKDKRPIDCGDSPLGLLAQELEEKEGGRIDPIISVACHSANGLTAAACQSGNVHIVSEESLTIIQSVFLCQSLCSADFVRNGHVLLGMSNHDKQLFAVAKVKVPPKSVSRFLKTIGPHSTCSGYTNRMPIQVCEHAEPAQVADPSDDAVCDVIWAQQVEPRIHAAPLPDIGEAQAAPETDEELPVSEESEAPSPAEMDKILLLKVSRCGPALQEALHNGRYLDELRTTMAAKGLPCKLPCGASVFVYPNQYDQIFSVLPKHDLRPHHILVNEAFLPLVFEALGNLPSKLNVHPREKKMLAYVPDHTEATPFVVEKTFINTCPRRLSDTITQSTSEFHRAPNPRR